MSNQHIASQLLQNDNINLSVNPITGSTQTFNSRAKSLSKGFFDGKRNSNSESGYMSLSQVKAKANNLINFEPTDLTNLAV